MSAENFRMLPSPYGGSLSVLQVLSTFWGLAAVLALGGYTLYDAVMGGQTGSATAAGRPASNASFSSSGIAAVSTGGPYPAIEPEPMVLYLACSQEDVSFDRISNRPPPGRYPFTLRLDQTPEDIRAVLNGTDTVYPKDARIVKTPCIQGMIDRGEFP